MTFWAHRRPGTPMTPPPACWPEPHINKFWNGVLNWAKPGIGREKNRLLMERAPWKMLPPVSPKILSRSGGRRTSACTTLLEKPGAYTSMVSKVFFTNCALEVSSQSLPPASLVGAYYTNMVATKLPSFFLFNEESKIEGMTSSTMGRRQTSPLSPS